MNNRLIDAPKLSKKFIKKYGFQYFTSGENADYLADELLGIHPSEEMAFLEAGNTAFQLLKQAARKIAFSPELMKRCGLPAAAQELLRWSIDHEADDYLIGRFDFAGGLEGLPIKLLEFNADTCSLMVETAFIQPEVLASIKQDGVKNELLESLAGRLNVIDKENTKNLLLSDLGFAEDQLTASIIGRAARMSHFTDVTSNPLEEIIFEPDDAVLVDIGAGQAKAFDIVYKAFPWDFVLFEEPELWELLTEMITTKRVKLLNPAWSMLMQCKGCMAVAWEQNPHHPLLLETSWEQSSMRSQQFVRKPIWGRMGENVAVFQSPNFISEQTEGDYGNSPMIYQQLAHFGIDADEHRYQISTFYSDYSCAITARRQDDMIMDDDAEFVSCYRL